ncbi:hypothetical protein G6F58_013667 [Rhizopus delemar]|nr:hypothetical protein G6F58_013667 [Rhizopus delemar]
MRACPLMRAAVASPAGGAADGATGAACGVAPAVAPPVAFIAAVSVVLRAGGAPGVIARAGAILDWICRAASESGGSRACSRSQWASASAASPRRNAIMPASAKALG